MQAARMQPTAESISPQSLLWLWMVEGQRPDRWDAIGALLCIAGAMVILLGPRSSVA